jgi:hypothetical protein
MPVDYTCCMRKHRYYMSFRRIGPPLRFGRGWLSEIPAVGVSSGIVSVPYDSICMRAGKFACKYSEFLRAFCS